MPVVFPPGYSTTMLEDFCRTLLSQSFLPGRLPPGLAANLPDRTRQLEDLRALRRYARVDHLAELFHQWIGEANGCEALAVPAARGRVGGHLGAGGMDRQQRGGAARAET